MSERTRRGTRSATVIAALVVIASGCVPHVNEEHVHAAKAAGDSRTVTERRQADPDIKTSVSGDTVNVSVQRRTECGTAISAPAKKVELDWRTCATKPLAHAPIALTAGGITMNGRTNDQGEVTLDTSSIASARDDPKTGTFDVAGEPNSASVSLANTPAYASWKKAADAREANALSKAAAAEAQHTKEADARALEAETAMLDKLETETSTLEHWRGTWGDDQVLLLIDMKNRLQPYTTTNSPQGPNTLRARRVAVRWAHLAESPSAQAAAQLMDQRRGQVEAQHQAEAEGAEGIRICLSQGLNADQCTPCSGRCWLRFKRGELGPAYKAVDALQACAEACN